MTEFNEPVTEAHEEYIDPKLCVSCQKNKFEPDYPTKLCNDCRQAFIKYPIPKWIWLFGAGVLVFMLIGIIRMPKYFNIARHYGKAEKAMENRNFTTAEKEWLIVTELLPNNLEANCNLFIASSYTHNYFLAGTTYDKIVGQQIQDDNLYNSVNAALTSIEETFYTDTTISYKIAEIKDSTTALLNFYNDAVAQHLPDEDLIGFSVADILYDFNMYEEVDTLLNKVLEHKPNFYPAKMLLAGVKRNTGKIDEANKICDELILINNEDYVAFSQKAKNEMKRKNDGYALELATRAMAIEPGAYSSLEAQAMAFFFTNKKQECFNLLKKIEQIEQSEANGEKVVSTRLKDLISGKEKYR